MSVLGRYTRYQVPGTILVALAAWLLWPLTGLPAWGGAVVVVAWIAKDAALYPLLRASYEPSDGADPGGMVGRLGLVTDALDPLGQIRVGAEIWRAQSVIDGATIAGGRWVRIEAAHGLTLSVVPVNAPE